MKPLLVSACPACGWRGFPQRLWCPRCGGQALNQQPAGRGVVTETTTVSHSVGHDLEPGVHVATIALDLGGTVIARLSAVDDITGTVFEDASAPTLVPD